MTQKFEITYNELGNGEHKVYVIGCYELSKTLYILCNMLIYSVKSVKEVK